MADATMSNVLKKSGKEIQADWAKDLASTQSASKGRISAAELEQQTAEFIKLLTAAREHAKASDISCAGIQAGPRIPRRRVALARRAGILVRRNGDRSSSR